MPTAFLSKNFSLHQNVPSQELHCSQNAVACLQLHCLYNENGFMLGVLFIKKSLFISFPE